MAVEIINLIDKNLKGINSTEVFKKYFEGILVEEIDDSYYLTNKVKGIGLVIDSAFIINSIHLYSGNDDTAETFRGGIPFDMEFSFGRDKIHAVLGKPIKSGGGHKILYMGYINYWDKYYFDNFSMHFQYSIDNSCIDLITIASLQLEEYFNSDLQ